MLAEELALYSIERILCYIVDVWFRGGCLRTIGMPLIRIEDERRPAFLATTTSPKEMIDTRVTRPLNRCISALYGI
jgi:hypothetical protein